MATYLVNYRAGAEIKTVTVSATSEVAAGRAFASSHPNVSADDILTVTTADYHRKYATAIFVSALISFAGWGVVILALLSQTQRDPQARRSVSAP